LKKKKQLLLALASLILLSGVYGLTQLLSKPEELNQEIPAAPRESYILSEVSEEELKSVTIENTMGAYTLILGEQGIEVKGASGIILDQQAAAGLTYALMNLRSSELIEKDSSDLDRYGLTNPRGLLTLEKRDGSKTIVKVGNSNPSKSGFYSLREGERSVYLLSSYLATSLLNSMDLLRDRTLPPVNFQELKRLTISSERTIDIVPYFPYEVLSSTLSPLVMVKPYRRPVAVNTQTYSKSMEALAQNYRIVSFYPDDTDKDTGLNDQAAEIYMLDSTGNEVNIQVGNKSAEGDYFCRVSHVAGIVTLPSEALTLINVSPLEMSDRFMRLIGIDSVKEVRVDTPTESWVGGILFLDDETGVFTFQGESVEEDPFKKMYQEILYLLFEGEIPGDFTPSGPAQFTVTYTGNDQTPGKTTAECYEYDQDYYAVSIDGYPPEFLIGKYQIESLLNYLRDFKG
jgi:hypothetical protein